MNKEITIRKATWEDAKGIARVHVDTWKSCYRGLISDDLLQTLSYKGKEEKWKQSLTGDTSITFVAINQEDEVIGFVTGAQRHSAERSFDSELRAIYVFPSYHRKGIGQLLAKELVTALMNQDCVSMDVWTLEKSPFRKFYESLGGRLLAETKTFGGAGELKLIGYGWDDIRSLS